MSHQPAGALPGGVGQLPAVVHDYPAAVLLVDTESTKVVYVNDLARQLAPDVRLPLDVEDWSRAAGLEVDPGSPLSASSTPLTRVAAGDPDTGRQVSAALRSEATEAREALWAIGMPLHDAPLPLRARSLLVLLPVRFPDAVAGVRAAAVVDRAHRSVLSSGLAMAISDPAAPDEPLVWVSRNFEQLTGWDAAEVLGRNCRFLQGPDTDPEAVANLRAGIAAGRTVSQVLLNYRQDGSAFYNNVVVSPVFDAEGRLIHRVSVQSDVTGQVVAAKQRDAALAEAAAARAAQAAAEDAGRFGRLLLTLSEALTATITVDQVAATITDVVAAELGAAGGGLLLADAARTHLRFSSLEHMPAGMNPSWARVAWDEDSPVAAAVRTRRAVFHRDREQLLAVHPDLPARAVLPSLGATVNLPLVVGRDVVGAVFLYWDQAQDFSAEQRAALQALAGYTAQAVQRATLISERRSAAEILQQSMLTRLPEPDHLEIRARYVPAAVGEYVGGDWYDAVVLPDGATTVVIGDVTGHDMTAAGHMGQLRGLLRAFAFDRLEPPSEVVSRLDRALAGLHVEGLATLVLARIEQTEEDAAEGLRRLRWTNAGHPPPVVLTADGGTEVMESEPELLIGLIPETVRTDQVHLLPPGSTVILYTDGLIEHRGRSLDDGLADLRRVLGRCGGLTLEELLDRLVVELVGDSPEDDCAILAVRAHPEDRPRPPEAGPGRIS
ncbi:SpoIIE family protein phosphatase [Kineococcus sp. R86509]|uniref:SpoIIE family protein phosphatase n=1 Tax=Kineococcus sp. R86509 TaxID=3093851 RepID=UPI0036D2B358